MSSNLIEFTKIELDYRFNKNDNFVYLKNKTEYEFFLENEGIKYVLLGSDTISFKFTDKNFNLKIFSDINKIDTELIINFFDFKINGIGENSFVESPEGRKMIKNLKSNDIIYDSTLNNLLVKCIVIFKIDDSNQVYPLKIKKNNCGINLPYEDFCISINQVIRIKNTFLKGRQLFLNRKGTRINSDNYNIYNIISDPFNNFLSNGFILNSYDTSN